MIYNNVVIPHPLKTELKRKLFHLSGLIYVLGLYWFPHGVYMFSLVVLLILEVAIEFLRLKNEYVRLLFKKYFGTLLREHEENHVSGVTWMTLGALCASLLVPVPFAASAMLYLILGDGIASLAGKTLKGPHWGHSPKRITGSLACLVVCLIIGFSMLYASYGWPVVVFGALAATIAEFGIIKINDNLSIPLLSSLVFIAILKTIV